MTWREWVALFVFTFVVSLIAQVAIVHEVWSLVTTIIIILVAAAVVIWRLQRQAAKPTV